MILPVFAAVGIVMCGFVINLFFLIKVCYNTKINGRR